MACNDNNIFDNPLEIPCSDCYNMPPISLTGVRNLCNSLNDLMDSRINYDQRLNMLIAWVKYLKSVTECLDCKFTNEITRLDALLETLTDLVNSFNKRITDLETCCNEIKNEIANILTRLNELESRITTLETRVSNLETRVSNIEENCCNGGGSTITAPLNPVTRYYFEMTTDDGYSEHSKFGLIGDTDVENALVMTMDSLSATTGTLGGTLGFTFNNLVGPNGNSTKILKFGVFPVDVSSLPDFPLSNISVEGQTSSGLWFVNPNNTVIPDKLEIWVDSQLVVTTDVISGNGAEIPAPVVLDAPFSIGTSCHVVLKFKDIPMEGAM